MVSVACKSLPVGQGVIEQTGAKADSAELMQTNDGVVTIDEGAGAKSRPIVSRFWLKGGRYRVTMPEAGWGHATLDQCQIGEASKPAYIEKPGPAGTIFFRLGQGFYRFVPTDPIEMQPKSAEVTRLET